jgi:hypothetical protein
MERFRQVLRVSSNERSSVGLDRTQPGLNDRLTAFTHA